MENNTFDFGSLTWWYKFVLFALVLEIIGHIIAHYILLLYRKYAANGQAKSKSEESYIETQAKKISSNYNDLTLHFLEYSREERSSEIKLVLALLSLIISFLGTMVLGNNLMAHIFCNLFGVISIVYMFIYIRSLKLIKRNYRIYLKAKDCINLKYDLTKIFIGSWQLTYKSARIREKQTVVIKSGNVYYGDNELEFNLKNVDIDNNNISFDKVRPNGAKHSTERLKIINDALIEGDDDIGFKLTYNKIIS